MHSKKECKNRSHKNSFNDCFDAFIIAIFLGFVNMKSHISEIFEEVTILKIKEYREKSGLLQEDVAKKLHIDQSAVSHWERGIHKPQKKYLGKLAKMINCSIDDLLKEEG